MKILFAASEGMPFVKTGGLADVIGALPKEIIKKGADIRVILPLYKAIDSGYRARMEHVLYFYINLGWRRQYVGIEKLVHDGVTFYFVDNEQYFGRDYIYGHGGDEGERFAYFCKAVLEALPKIDFMPDVIHCHDWQTGLIPALYTAQYKNLPLYQGIKTVFTIHNLQFQGLYPISATEELLSLGSWAYTSDNLEFYGQCSFIKGGLVFADRITTVSPTYAEEILSPYYGERMDGLLRARKNALSGILNGIDTIEYDPAKDTLIDSRYDAEHFEAKKPNKAALQKELGLEEDDSVPLIAMVTRLSGQKGLDLVERVLDGIMNTGAQFVVLGMGESKYMDLFGWAQWKYSGKLAACFQMNHRLAHRIYAAADLFLMPSMFEPCGLSQLISLRYGTLPITRETGGLRDTVLSYNEYTGDGNGFTFFNYNAHDMLHVIERAVGMYKNDRETFEFLARRAMGGEYGWDKSAAKYVELYEDLTGQTGTAPIEATAEAPADEAEKPKPARKPRAKKEAEAAEPAKKPRAKKAETAEEKPAPKKRTSKKAKTEE
ncbi:MAG: glycogen synthase GlgA [Clostridia bacterium]|jgi:glycogen/starch synthases, ADP-glucose type|nr:glycogen synthase GlgA [Clostridia bacterium]MBR5379505.1 glycogen synthase GlgA [Clostridia bacterium]MBR5752179.1 glycogen synthase GlgA [Clostridia bacterium]